MGSNELYTSYFGLKERPFTMVPDPGFLYWSQQHKRAFAVLEYGILTGAPITLITGEVGAGKTTLLQKLLPQIDDDVSIGLVSNAQGDRGELIQWILNALQIETEPDARYVKMFQALQDFLLAEFAKSRRVILIFDEAQNLSLESLEELRMLTNINSNKDVLIQLILVGQPELRAMVQRPEMRQLAQRVAASFHLGKMAPETVTKYIGHRLRVAGGSGNEFTPDACAIIHRETDGVPRQVNKLCDFGMLYAWSGEEKIINVETIEQILKDGVYFGGFSYPEEETA